MRSTRKRITHRLLLRAAITAAWVVFALASTTQLAHAIGLPFVDLPTASSVASDAMDSASRAIVNLIASGVATLTNEIITVSDTVAAPQVGSGNAWFTASYKRTVAVSLHLMAIASLIAITAAGIRGKVGDIAQVVFVGIPGSVVAMMLATLGVHLSLSLTDAMTAYTFRSSVSNIQTFLHDIGVVFTATDGAAQGTAALAPGLVLIIGLLMIVAQLVILAVLIVRAALIYIVTLFLPLVFAVQVWPATRHMTRKALELLAVLILSKFAIFTCFALGAGAMRSVLDASGSSGGPPAVQSAIVGLGVMAAAAFSPMLLLSIIPGIAGSFGAGMPGGTTGAGALAVKTPSQIMRSTLAGTHTVRGGASTHATSGATGARRATNRSSAVGNAGGSGSGSSRATRGTATTEQAHTAASAHPATAAGAASAQALTRGAREAVRATTPARTGPEPEHSQSTGSTAPLAASQPLPDRPQPHVVSERSSAQPAASTSATSADSQQPRDGQQRLGIDAAPSSPDGFTAVSTRKPFTLETI